MEHEGPHSILTQVARSYIGTTSVEQVDEFRRAVDRRASKESWCVGFVWYCLLQVIKQDARARVTVPPTELVAHLWDYSPVRQKSHQPQTGHIACWIHAGTISGHCGIVLGPATGSTFQTVEGNTSSPDWTRVNGVWEKTRVTHSSRAPQRGDLTLLGFIDPFRA